MADSLDRVLIPIDVSRSVSDLEIVTETVRSSEVVLLGYWEIPDQSTARQHRDQFEEEARNRLQTIANQYTTEGIEVQSRVAFTKDRDRLIDSAVNEYECQSVLVPGTETTGSETSRGLVLVKPDADLDRIVRTLGELFAETDIKLLLFHVAEEENKHLYDAREYMLRGLADRLIKLGFDADQVDWEQSTEGDRLDAIVSRFADYDFVVLGETAPTLREQVFGTVQSTLTEKTDKPQLTVRTSV